MPIKNSPERSADGLETFKSYVDGDAECIRRNKQLAIERGQQETEIEINRARLLRWRTP